MKLMLYQQQQIVKARERNKQTPQQIKNIYVPFRLFLTLLLDPGNR